jgi:hypothetical protein
MQDIILPDKTFLFLSLSKYYLPPSSGVISLPGLCLRLIERRTGLGLIAAGRCGTGCAS